MKKINLKKANPAQAAGSETADFKWMGKDTAAVLIAAVLTAAVRAGFEYMTGGDMDALSPGFPALVAFFLTFFMLKHRFSFLPVDHGRQYAVQGMASKGKLRGVGIIMVICFLVTSLVFVRFSFEYLIYAILIFIEMMSGYLDDASSSAWQDYKKGAIDLGVSLLTGIVFVVTNSTNTYIGKAQITLHPVVYVVLAAVLVWASINATNCVDGVDGLCGSLSIITILSIALIYMSDLNQSYFEYSLIMAGVLLAYLIFNTKPSSMLMGDAGSRAIGVLIAILIMKSGHPLSYLVLAIVMIVDGLTGLVKVFFKRFFHISFFRTLKTPLHDEMRRDLLTGEDTTPKPKKPRVRNWQDPQIVARFCIIQTAASVLWYALGL